MDAWLVEYRRSGNFRVEIFDFRVENFRVSNYVSLQIFCNGSSMHVRTLKNLIFVNTVDYEIF